MNMNKSGILVAMTFALFFPDPVDTFAQEAKMDIEEYYRCLEVADGDDNISRNECIGVASGKCISEYSTASGKATCWSKETELWDQMLNQIYQELGEAMPKGEFKTGLKNTQRAWIKFRDNDCRLYAAMGLAGAPESQLFESCMMDHTAKRANALAELNQIVQQVAN